MTTEKLFKALKNGFGISKDEIDKYGLVGTEFWYYDKDRDYFVGKGYGSECGDFYSRFRSIFKNPEEWRIVGTFEEKDWLKIPCCKNNE